MLTNGEKKHTKRPAEKQQTTDVCSGRYSYVTNLVTTPILGNQFVQNLLSLANICAKDVFTLYVRANSLYIQQQRVSAREHDCPAEQLHVGASSSSTSYPASLFFLFLERRLEMKTAPRTAALGALWWLACKHRKQGLSLTLTIMN